MPVGTFSDLTAIRVDISTVRGDLLAISEKTSAIPTGFAQFEL